MSRLLSSSNLTRSYRIALIKAHTLARGTFPGGTLVDLPHDAYAERVALTRKLIDEGAPAIFEASFIAANTFVAVDVLTPRLVECRDR